MFSAVSLYDLISEYIVFSINVLLYQSVFLSFWSFANFSLWSTGLTVDSSVWQNMELKCKSDLCRLWKPPFHPNCGFRGLKHILHSYSGGSITAVRWVTNKTSLFKSGLLLFSVNSSRLACPAFSCTQSSTAHTNSHTNTLTQREPQWNHWLCMCLVLISESMNEWILMEMTQSVHKTLGIPLKWTLFCLNYLLPSLHPFIYTASENRYP